MSKILLLKCFRIRHVIYTPSWIQFYCMLKLIIKGSKTWEHRKAEMINNQNTADSRLPSFNKSFYFIWSKCFCLKNKTTKKPLKSIQGHWNSSPHWAPAPPKHEHFLHSDSGPFHNIPKALHVSVSCSDTLNYYHRMSSIKCITGGETQNMQCVGLKRGRNKNPHRIVSKGTNNSEVVWIIYRHLCG